MLLTERMAKITIVCLREDLDLALNALDDFGLFHIEEARTQEHGNHYDAIRKMKETSTILEDAMKNLGIKAPSVTLFKREKFVKRRFHVEDWLRFAEDIRKEALDIADEVNGILKSLKEVDAKIAELRNEMRILKILNLFNIDPRVFTKLRLIRVFIATVSVRHVLSLSRALSHLPAVYYFREIGHERAFMFVATTGREAQTVERILETYDAEPFIIPKDVEEQKPSKALLLVKRQLKKYATVRSNIVKQIEKLSRKHRERLLSLREAARNIESALKAKESVLRTKKLAQIVGYVPQSSLHELKKRLKKFLGDRFILFPMDQTLDEDPPPTALRNPGFIKYFEIITRLYGLPSYDEVDPTPIIAVTFPLIFGLMFGDLGHGLILFLGGLLLSFIIKSPEEWRAYFRILAICGFGAIIAGLLFGEAFGKRMFPPLWMDPFENVLSFLIFSLIIGVLQITSGFILDMINFIVKRRYIDAFTVSLPKIVFYGMAVYFLMECGLDFDLWLSAPIFYMTAALIFLFLGKPLVMLVLEKKGFLHAFGERIFEGSELILSLLSNTMSYSRILALLMAHWALLTVTYVISGLVSSVPVVGGILGALIIVFGNIFVVAFEGLIVFIHTLRLHFYEWFSKFYEGAGTPFQPFRFQREFTEIILRHKC